MKRLIALLSLLVIASVLISACAPATTEAPPATEAPTEVVTEAPTEAATEAPTEAATEAPTEAATEPAAAADCSTDELGCVDIAPGEPVHIAYWGVLSGADGTLGEDSKRGVEIAVDDMGGEFRGHEIL